ncbi:hypothetical protein A3K69_01395 [Candidatus Bathyarchaeota archaeon RBG_16_57_9]|nr:MAG: hypothetical protein A3K69_01395 [Candidatus Bathyarchaeota archaeon RBG_16_57_9]
MQSETISAPWLLRVYWEELATLLVCLSLDLIELLSPTLLSPITGDLLDFAGLLFAALYFKWFAAIGLLELLPGLDAVPFLTLSWAAWFAYRRRRMRRSVERMLEDWL